MGDASPFHLGAQLPGLADFSYRDSDDGIRSASAVASGAASFQANGESVAQFATAHIDGWANGPSRSAGFAARAAISGRSEENRAGCGGHGVVKLKNLYFDHAILQFDPHASLSVSFVISWEGTVHFSRTDERGAVYAYVNGALANPASVSYVDGNSETGEEGYQQRTKREVLEPLGGANHVSAKNGPEPAGSRRRHHRNVSCQPTVAF